jgi:spermidine/putrescine transport system permease protein
VSTVESRSASTAPPATGPEVRPAPAKRPKDFDRPRFLKVYMGLFFLLLFAPIALVVLFSFNSSRSLQDFQGFSLRW